MFFVDSVLLWFAQDCPSEAQIFEPLSPDGGTVWGCLEGIALLEEACLSLGDGFESQNIEPLLACSLCSLLILEDVSSRLCFPRLFHKLISFITDNRKVTNIPLLPHLLLSGTLPLPGVSFLFSHHTCSIASHFRIPHCSLSWSLTPFNSLCSHSEPHMYTH